jgi:hypothetical protein
VHRGAAAAIAGGSGGDSVAARSRGENQHTQANENPANATRFIVTGVLPMIVVSTGLATFEVPNCAWHVPRARRRKIEDQRTVTLKSVLKAVVRADAPTKNATAFEGRTRDLAGMSAAIHGGMQVRTERALEAQ